MPVYGLIGNPLGHTWSKKYFTEKFIQENRPGHSYENFELSTISEITEIIEKVEDLRGLNVTIPFKEKVLSYLHHKDDVVEKVKACNCIKFLNGKLHGFNTDVFGFVNSFAPLLNDRDLNALVLGTGGSSKAICVGLSQLGIRYSIVSRAGLGENVIDYASLDRANVEAHTIIINCTPLGSASQKETKPPIPYNFLTQHHYLFDVVYNPAKSNFLLEGEKAGARIKNGEEMLILQAEESWRIWNSN